MGDFDRDGIVGGMGLMHAAESVLLENDNMGNVPGCWHQDKPDACNNIGETEEWTTKSSRKMNISVKEGRRKRSLSNEYLAMIEDLKVFVDSLTCELTVARENVSADMRREMKSMTANWRPSKKNVKVSDKNKEHWKIGTEAGMKLENCSMDDNMATDAYKLSKHVAEDVTYDQLPELKTTSHPDKVDSKRSGLSHTMLAPHLAPSSVPPEPQSRNQRIRIPAGGPPNNLSSETEVAALMNAENIHHQDAQFHSHGSMFGLLEETCSETPFTGADFPAPMLQMHNGPVLSCSNNSFLYNTRVGLKFNGQVTPALSDCVFPFPNSINSSAHCKDGGAFVSLRPQDLKNGQCCPTSSRNQQ